MNPDIKMTIEALEESHKALYEINQKLWVILETLGPSGKVPQGSKIADVLVSLRTDLSIVRRDIEKESRALR